MPGGSRQMMEILPLSARGAVRDSPTARSADRAVLVRLRRFPAVIQATVTLPFWQMEGCHFGRRGSSFWQMAVRQDGNLGCHYGK